MRQWPQHSMWQVGDKVQGWRYKVYWNIVWSLWVSQVRANPTTSILPVGVESTSIPWTLHTRGANEYIPKFWTCICRLVESEANWEVRILMQSWYEVNMTHAYQIHYICKIIIIFFKLAYTKIRTVIVSTYTMEIVSTKNDLAVF